MEQEKKASVEESMDLASLALSWSGHCQSMPEKSTLRANQTIDPPDAHQKPSMLLAYESEEWAGMGKSLLAQSIYALDLTQGERALVCSIAAPNVVRRLILAQGHDRLDCGVLNGSKAWVNFCVCKFSRDQSPPPSFSQTERWACKPS